MRVAETPIADTKDRRVARRRWGFVIAALAGPAVALFTLAAAYEVTSVTSSLGRMVRNFRGASAPLGPPAATPGRTAGTAERGGTPSSRDVPSRSVSFSVTEEDLNRLWRRRAIGLGGALIWERDVSSRLAAGRIRLMAKNALRLVGLPVMRYSGSTDWSLAAADGAVGVRLNNLTVAGIPFPSRIVSRLSGGARDGWIHLQVSSRQVVDRVQVADGKLLLRGSVR